MLAMGRFLFGKEPVREIGRLTDKQKISRQKFFVFDKYSELHYTVMKILFT